MYLKNADLVIPHNARVLSQSMHAQSRFYTGWLLALQALLSLGLIFHWLLISASCALQYLPAWRCNKSNHAMQTLPHWAIMPWWQCGASLRGILEGSNQQMNGGCLYCADFPCPLGVCRANNNFLNNRTDLVSDDNQDWCSMSHDTTW